MRIGNGAMKNRRPAANTDLTAKARIRNAALELHATKGEPNTTVREVAQAAGVTHGLVVHHFVNKEGLHKAVQQHVVDLLRQALSAVPTDGTPREIGKARDASVARMYSEHPVYLRYIRRQVRDLRVAGIAPLKTPEPIQVFAVLMRELAPRLLEPMVQRIWRHLAGKSGGPPPEIELRIKRD